MLTTVTVRQLNCYIKSLMDGDVRLNRIAVTGEISNFKNHYASGHWYFSLKDDTANLRCMMFRNDAVKSSVTLRDGMLVTAIGQVTVYERDGQYQLYVQQISLAGAGEAAARFEEIKQRLTADGLISAENRRSVPRFPHCVAVITSETGAAVQDILKISARRFPAAEMLLCPVAVQGENAAREMTDTLERVYRLGRADVIIIGRGGGSAEDLQAFNNEALARKIFESPVPIVSAVGHETDFSISDFVADLRAPTPSAAAELCLPDGDELILHIAQQHLRLQRAMTQIIAAANNQLQALRKRPVLYRPDSLLEAFAMQNDRLQVRLNHVQKQNFSVATAHFSNLLARLEALNPLQIMKRGFAYVTNENQPVCAVRQIKRNDMLTLRFADGELDCTVKEIRCGK